MWFVCQKFKTFIYNCHHTRQKAHLKIKVVILNPWICNLLFNYNILKILKKILVLKIKLGSYRFDFSQNFHLKLIITLYFYFMYSFYFFTENLQFRKIIEPASYAQYQPLMWPWSLKLWLWHRPDKNWS